MKPEAVPAPGIEKNAPRSWRNVAEKIAEAALLAATAEATRAGVALLLAA